jgi:hypothetical protein
MGSVCRPTKLNPENAVKNLVSFLPVLAYDGANMTQIDAGGSLDIAMAGTSATLLARKWESVALVGQHAHQDEDGKPEAKSRQQMATNNQL